MGTCWRKLLDVVYAGDLEGTNATQRCVEKDAHTSTVTGGMRHSSCPHLHLFLLLLANTQTHTLVHCRARDKGFRTAPLTRFVVWSLVRCFSLATEASPSELGCSPPTRRSSGLWGMRTAC
jgi:hypothetical protein